MPLNAWSHGLLANCFSYQSGSMIVRFLTSRSGPSGYTIMNGWTFILGVDGLIASILTLEGRPKSDTKLDAAVASSTRKVIENERRRVNEYLGEFAGNKDREISRLREELAYANSRIPPAEIFGDPGYMEWWLAHRYDD